MSRSKKIVLCFPPLTMPTSPPLGAAMLKAYVERELPDWHVKVVDLNLWAFDRLFGLLASGQLQLAGSAFPDGAPALLLEAAQVFRGRRAPEVFETRPDLYEVYADLFMRFTQECCRALIALSQANDRGEPLSPLLQEMIDLILAENPDCVGFSMIFSEQLPVGATLGRVLRQKHGMKVFLGGSCFTDTAEHFLKWYPESADVVIAGEGEDALKILLTSLNSPEKVPGAVFLTEGKVRKVAGYFREEIDVFGPPDFSDTDPHNYFSPQPIVPLLLSRGCYWRRCTFCVHYRSAGLSYRMHSMPYFVKMLQGLVAQGVRHFAFIDEMIAPKHFEKLAVALEEARLDIRYYALTKPVRYFTPNILQMMAKSGCKYLLWGLESANQRVLNLMDKGTVVPEIAKVLADATAAGIANHVFMICGFPTETVEEFGDTIRFLQDNRDHLWAIHRGNFGLERESPIFDAPQRYGITRVWLQRDDASGGRWGYETSSGMSMEQAAGVFASVQPLLRAFNPYARTLANFRDHALIVYDRVGKQLQPERRQFPHIGNQSGASTPISVALRS